MKLYIGADHRGFKLKQALIEWLQSQGHEVEDCGNTRLDPADDYPDYASYVAERVKNSSEDARGILLCGSGVGVSIAANKHKGIRAGLGINREQVASATEHDHINVLALAADFVTLDQAKEMVDVFLQTNYSPEERHVRRVGKIE